MAAGRLTSVVALLAAVAVESAPAAELRSQAFDRDPGWEGVNHRLVPPACPTTAQDFGHRPTALAASTPGEVGGRVWNSYRPAHYGKVLEPARTLEHRLSASGTLRIERGSSYDPGKGRLAGGALFGFYNSASRDWRTPSSLVFRLEEDGAGQFVIGPEYGTRRYAAYGARVPGPGGTLHLATGTRYRWRLAYDPRGAAGRGRIHFAVEGAGSVVLDLRPGHRRQGATFDRFGLLNRMIEGNDITVYFGDLTLNSDRVPLGAGRPRGWSGQSNQRSFADCVIDNHHDFGYTAGGGGEVPAHAAGGVIWRTEAAVPQLYAHYADRVGPFGLRHALHAEGTIRLVRASSDSAVNFGFFRSGAGGQGESVPHHFVGINTDGPSAVGFYFRPALRTATGPERRPRTGPIILPDGRPHRWTLRYVPLRTGTARLTVTLDGREVSQYIAASERTTGATLDRFGIRNVTVGGHAQVVYLDDLRYSG